MGHTGEYSWEECKGWHQLLLRLYKSARRSSGGEQDGVSGDGLMRVADWILPRSIFSYCERAQAKVERGASQN